MRERAKANVIRLLIAKARIHSTYQTGKNEMIVRIDHSHLQGHFEDYTTVGIVQIENDIENVSSDRIDENAAIFVVRELSNKNIRLIETWIVE
jgi:hypothetical protein